MMGNKSVEYEDQNNIVVKRSVESVVRISKGLKIGIIKGQSSRRDYRKQSDKSTFRIPWRRVNPIGTHRVHNTPQIL